MLTYVNILKVERKLYVCFGMNKFKQWKGSPSNNVVSKKDQLHQTIVNLGDCLEKVLAGHEVDYLYIQHL